MVNVVSEFAREGVLSEILYADLILLSETIEELKICSGNIGRFLESGV